MKTQEVMHNLMMEYRLKRLIEFSLDILKNQPHLTVENDFDECSKAAEDYQKAYLYHIDALRLASSPDRSINFVCTDGMFGKNSLKTSNVFSDCLGTSYSQRFSNEVSLIIAQALIDKGDYDEAEFILKKLIVHTVDFDKINMHVFVMYGLIMIQKNNLGQALNILLDCEATIKANQEIFKNNDSGIFLNNFILDYLYLDILYHIKSNQSEDYILKSSKVITQKTNFNENILNREQSAFFHYIFSLAYTETPIKQRSLLKYAHDNYIYTNMMKNTEICNAAYGYTPTSPLITRPFMQFMM